MGWCVRRFRSYFYEASVGTVLIPRSSCGGIGVATGLERLALQMDVRVEMDYEGKSLKSQIRRADKLGVRYSVVMGGNEVASGRADFKRMADGVQVEGGWWQMRFAVSSGDI